jgi:hypothetical protein
MDEQEKNTALSQNAKPEPTWFFEGMKDGKIFACKEEEAWNIMQNPSNWARRDFRMVGHSNGETYFNIIKNSKNEVALLKEEREQLSLDLNKHLQTEDELRFKQLKDDDDEMVKKVVVKRRELQTKMADIDKQLSDISRTIITKAFDAELEVARTNQTLPRNMDVYTPDNKDRNIILNNIGR